MEKLYSPWRSLYIESFNKKSKKGIRECIFCKAASETKDKKNFVLRRYKYWFSLLNLYPYNAGHIMIAPYRHLDDMVYLQKEEQNELIKIVNDTIAALRTTMQPEGFNIGMNMGKVAGAGIDHHIHWHIVPRWNGDTNFMPVLNDVKIVSQEMKKTWALVRNELKKNS